MQNFQKLIKLPQLFLFLLGNAFVAYSYQGFVSANDFVSGGIYGISGIITYFFNFLPFPLIVLLLNIPCMIWAWRELDKRFVIMTTIALLLQVCFLQLFEGVVIYNNDLLLAAIFAGVFVGAGDALVLRSGSGSSGVHLIAMVMRQKFGISVSTVTTCINTVIILLSTGIFGIEKGLYTLILIFASGQVVHAILDGLSSKRTAFIITTKGEEVGAALIEGLNRGVTKLAAEGLYSHTPVSLLMCVTNMLEVGRLKTLVQSIDPQAFITFYETTDFRGHFLKHNIIVDKDEDAETASMQAPPKRPSRPKPLAAPAPAPAPTSAAETAPKYQLTIQPNTQTATKTTTNEDIHADVHATIQSILKATAQPAEDVDAPEAPEVTDTTPEAPEVTDTTPEAPEVTDTTTTPAAPAEVAYEPTYLPETAAAENTESDAVHRLRDHSLARDLSQADETDYSNNMRESFQPDEDSSPNVSPHPERPSRADGLTRPEHRSFVPPAPPGSIHLKNRSNSDFWADSNDKRR